MDLKLSAFVGTLQCALILDLNDSKHVDNLSLGLRIWFHEKLQHGKKDFIYRSLLAGCTFNNLDRFRGEFNHDICDER